MQFLSVQITEFAGALDQFGVVDGVSDKPGFGYRTDIWCIDQQKAARAGLGQGFNGLANFVSGCLHITITPALPEVFEYEPLKAAAGSLRGPLEISHPRWLAQHYSSS